MEGEIFEGIISWITKSLHSAEVLTNQKLTDIHTGKKRQIDILIKITDGLLKLTGIVEARDRSRPVGVEYVEQIHSKKTSVGADFAVIVSNKGFYSTALEKSRQLGIRLFSLEDALQADWSQTITSLKVIEQAFKTEGLEIVFLEKESGNVIVPSQSVLAEIAANKDAFVLKTKEGEPVAHLPSLIRPFQRILENGLKVGKENGAEFMLFFDMVSEPPIYIQNDKSEDVLINYFKVKAFCWLEHIELTPVVSHYKNKIDDKLTAEIVSLNLSTSKEKVDFIISNPNDIDKDRTIKFQSKKENEIVPPKTESQYWFTLNKMYQKYDGRFYLVPKSPDKV
ncbi:MAG TPA: restriction endonuclease [Agriterribacter sp.]|nr:restriction endonuclease [Chitinophagaceae bacterium]HRP32305.1 restriction endonuclease [Agriterribacter sp.]